MTEPSVKAIDRLADLVAASRKPQGLTKKAKGCITELCNHRHGWSDSYRARWKERFLDLGSSNPT